MLLPHMYDFFPILSYLSRVKATKGSEALQQELLLFDEDERKELNAEVSILLCGHAEDPFIDFIRMQKYMEN
jgi:hypothetical protein